MIEVCCSFCNKKLNIYSSKYKFSKTKRFYCNVECKSNWQKGRKASIETIEKLKKVTGKERNGRYIDGHTYKTSYCSCGNKKDFRAKKCYKCYDRKGMNKNKIYSKEERINIGKKSKEKFLRKEYRERLPYIIEKALNTRIEKGLMVPFEEKPLFEIYRKEANWIDNMIGYASPDKLLLFQEKGFFNPKSNREGIVRDHLYTRKSGFLNKVFPEILRHPVNCSFILMKENAIKGGRFDSIPLNVLFQNIKNFQLYWKEQEKCLFLIKSFEEGKRWNRPTFIEHLQTMNKGGIC